MTPPWSPRRGGGSSSERRGLRSRRGFRRRPVGFRRGGGRGRDRARERVVRLAVRTGSRWAGACREGQARSGARRAGVRGARGARGHLRPAEGRRLGSARGPREPAARRRPGAPAHRNRGLGRRLVALHVVSARRPGAVPRRWGARVRSRRAQGTVSRLVREDGQPRSWSGRQGIRLRRRPAASGPITMRCATSPSPRWVTLR